VVRLDTVRSKEMHVSDLVAATGDFKDGAWLKEGNRLVWVVVMSGDYVPDVPGLPGGAPVPHYSSAISVAAAAADGDTPILSLHADNSTQHGSTRCQI